MLVASDHRPKEPVYTTGDQSLAEAMWMGKAPDEINYKNTYKHVLKRYKAQCFGIRLALFALIYHLYLDGSG